MNIIPDLHPSFSPYLDKESHCSASCPVPEVSDQGTGAGEAEVKAAATGLGFPC